MALICKHCTREILGGVPACPYCGWLLDDANIKNKYFNENLIRPNVIWQEGSVKITRENIYDTNVKKIYIPQRHSIEIIREGKRYVYSCETPTVINADSTDYKERIYLYPFKKQYVSNRVTENLVYQRIMSINKDARVTPIFIDAQTGDGKSYTIFHEVLPAVKKSDKRLLLLASRKALKNQHKYDAIDAEELKEMSENFSPKGIENEHTFGAIDVYSYQDLDITKHCQDLEEKIKNHEYGAIVFDECHYFISDADFISTTEKQFCFILNRAIRYNILRIYMTATPYYVYDEIYKIEYNMRFFNDTNTYIRPMYNTYPNNANSNSQLRQLRQFDHFYFERDYSYLQISFFHESDLTNILKNCAKAGRKVLVFVNSKNRAQTEINALRTCGITCFLFDADAGKEGKEGKEGEDEKETYENVKNELLNNEIGVDVLFATKCLDVGVTVKTKDLIIVNLLMDDVDFIQAIGRKRLSTKNEDVHLYIPLYSEKDIKIRKNQLQNSYHELNELYDYYHNGQQINGSFDIEKLDKLQKFAYADNGKYWYNSFAWKKLEHQISTMDQLLLNIANKSEKKQEAIIANYWLSLLERNGEFSTDMVLFEEDRDTERGKILNLIQQYEVEKMNEEKFNEFCEQLRAYDKRTDSRESRQEISTQTVNDIFKRYNLDYKIEGRTLKSPYAVYTIKKGKK